MGQVMKADCSAGTQAWAQAVFGATDELWVTLCIYFESGARDRWAAAGDGSTWADLVMLVTAGATVRLDLGVDGTGPDPEFYFIDAAGQVQTTTTPAPPTGSWHTYEFHWKRNDVEEFYLDGTLLLTLTAEDSAITRLNVGIIDTDSADAANVAYFDNVKVGTTRGGTDIFSDDFESGSFAAWDSVSADASVVDDAVTGGGCGGGGGGGGGIHLSNVRYRAERSN